MKKIILLLILSLFLLTPLISESQVRNTAKSISTIDIIDEAVTLPKLAGDSVDSIKVVDNSLSGSDFVNPLRIPHPAFVNGLFTQIIGGSVPTWDHAPTGAGIEGSIEVDGNFFADAEAAVVDSLTVGKSLIVDGGMLYYNAVTNGLLAKTSITIGDDVANLSGTLNFISAGGALANFAINDSDHLVMVGNDGAGKLVGADFAGLYLKDTATTITIALVDAYEKLTIFEADMPEQISNAAFGTHNITIGATGVYEVSYSGDIESAGGAKVYGVDVFEITTVAAGTAITGITKATPGVVTTSTDHGLTNGDRVKITGVVGMVEVNDNIYTIANKGDKTFELTDDEGVNIATGTYTDWSSVGTVHLATRLDALHAHAEFAVQDDARTSSASAFVSLTGANTLEIYVKDVTDDTNCIITTGQFSIKRIY